MTKRRSGTKDKHQQAAKEKKHPAESSLNAFSMWQAWAIAQVVFELAESLETVGAKDSALDKIDILRRAISEVCEPAMDGQSGARPVKRKVFACELEMRDIFQAILKQVISCYPSSEAKSMPEMVHKLRELSERLRHYAGDFKKYMPMEKLTDEMRALADDLKHTDQDGYPIMWIFERAAMIKSMLLEIYCDVVYDTETGQRRIRKELIGDWSEMSAEEKVKKLGELRSEIFIDGEAETESYTFQAMLILDRIDPRKTWSEKCPGDLRYFADQLDKCPPVMQYRKFWNILKSKKGEADFKPKDETPAVQQPLKMSLPLSLKRWASILRVSIGTVRAWKNDPKSKYHFQSVSANSRKWRLPQNEIPAEYLERYKKSVS